MYSPCLPIFGSPSSQSLFLYTATCMDRRWRDLCGVAILGMCSSRCPRATTYPLLDSSFSLVSGYGTATGKLRALTTDQLSTPCDYPGRFSLTSKMDDSRCLMWVGFEKRFRWAIGSSAVSESITYQPPPLPPISSPPTRPNCNRTPSTSTTSYQSASVPTVAAAHNEETETRSVEGYY